MRRRWHSVSYVATAVAIWFVGLRLGWAEPPSGAHAAGATKFLRVARDAQGQPLALQSAVVRYAKTNPKSTSRADDTGNSKGAAAPPAGDGFTVDLIAAVHIGEKEYFEALNRLFDQYDAVLYELVAPKGTRVPKNGKRRSRHPVSMLQNSMKDMLKLEFQLEQIDYERENFVHADMSPDELAKAMQRRGEDPISMFFRMMGRAIAFQARQPQRRKSGGSELSMLFAMLNKDRDLALKRLMADQFDDLEGAMSILEGPEGSSLLSDRNQAAVDVLAEQIEQGKRRLAIFYGAAHMPDIAQRLEKRFGLKPIEHHWIDAWDLRPRSKSSAKKQEKTEATNPKD